MKYLPSVTLGKVFVECKITLAECKKPFPGWLANVNASIHLTSRIKCVFQNWRIGRVVQTHDGLKSRAASEGTAKCSFASPANACATNRCITDRASPPTDRPTCCFVRTSLLRRLLLPPTLVSRQSPSANWKPPKGGSGWVESRVASSLSPMCVLPSEQPREDNGNNPLAPGSLPAPFLFLLLLRRTARSQSAVLQYSTAMQKSRGELRI
jgi:hypothetical protein